MSISSKLRAGAVVWSIALSMTGVQRAVATENGLTHYPVGVNTIATGMLPPPGGTAFYSYSAYYRSTNLTGPGGSSIDPGFSLSVVAEAPKLVHTWEPTFGPFFFASSVIVPVSHVEVEAFGQYDTSTGFGDPILSPLYIGYINPNSTLFAFLGLDVYIPIGKYDKNKLANNGLNYWTIAPSLSVTWLPDPRWEISGIINFELNTENTATDYLSGNSVILDGSVGYYPFSNIPKLKFAVQGYAYIQFTDDEANGVTVPGGNRGRVFGLGPQISYDVVQGGGFVLKYQREFGAENRAEGDRFWFQFAVPF